MAQRSKIALRKLLDIPVKVLAVFAVIFGASTAAADAFSGAPSPETLRVSDRLIRMGDRYLATDNAEAAGKIYRFARAARIANDMRVSGVIVDAVMKEYGGKTQLARSESKDTRPKLSLVSQAVTGAPATQVRAGAHGSDRYVAYPTEVHVNGSRAWRNNNPGNIKAGPFATAHGAIGSDGTFAIFPSLDVGRAAQQTLIENRYANQTIEQMIRKYAPASENDTENYINFVHNATAIDSNRTINSLNAADLQSVIDAMDKIEGALIVGTVYRAGNATNPGWVSGLLSGTES